MLYVPEHVAALAQEMDIDAKDCTVTVALKITDDSCKMDDDQRAIFMAVYDALPEYESVLFDASVHEIIRTGRTAPTAFTYGEIRKRREAAMDAITRPKMKAYKAWVRQMLAEKAAQ